VILDRNATVDCLAAQSHGYCDDLAQAVDHHQLGAGGLRGIQNAAVVRDAQAGVEAAPFLEIQDGYLAAGLGIAASELLRRLFLVCLLKK
jgi:hypothetical protein